MVKKLGPPRCRLEVEGLESRLVPAGNVTAFVVGGSLMIQGDAAANSVFVAGQGAGQFSVAGFNQTTVNGVAPVNGISTVILSGAPNSVFVDLGDGNDFFVLANAVVVGSATVLGEGGNDILAFSGSVFHGPVTVDAGAGNDLLNIQQSFFVGSFNAQLRDGNDLVLVRNSGFAANATWNGGSGFDFLLDLHGNFFAGGVTANDFAFMSPFFGTPFSSLPFGGTPFGGGPIGGIVNGIIVR